MMLTSVRGRGALGNATGGVDEEQAATDKAIAGKGGIVGPVALGVLVVGDDHRQRVGGRIAVLDEEIVEDCGGLSEGEQSAHAHRAALRVVDAGEGRERGRLGQRRREVVAQLQLGHVQRVVGEE